MGKQITPKKRLFAEEYARSQSVVEAAAFAGYSNYKSCYKLVATNDAGEYTDEVMRSLLAGFGMAGVKAPPKPLPLPAPIRNHQKKLAKVLTFSEHRPQVVDGVLTLDAVRHAMWELATDIDTPAGPRVQALNVLLKDLREQEIPEPPSDEDLLDTLKVKLGVKRVIGA